MGFTFSELLVKPSVLSACDGIRVNALQSGHGLFVEGVREGGLCGSVSVFDVLLELLRVSYGSRSRLTKLCRTTRREKKSITTQREATQICGSVRALGFTVFLLHLLNLGEEALERVIGSWQHVIQPSLPSKPE